MQAYRLAFAVSTLVLVFVFGYRLQSSQRTSIIPRCHEEAATQLLKAGIYVQIPAQYAPSLTDTEPDYRGPGVEVYVYKSSADCPARVLPDILQLEHVRGVDVSDTAPTDEMVAILPEQLPELSRAFDLPAVE